MTLAEYELRMISYRLKRLNKSREIHEQAWANNQIKTTKKIGKKEVPYFKKFKDFFDMEKQEKEILGKGEEVSKFINP
ncbi:hypothetical protein JZO86_05940 [Enterococcus ureasiticus]|nr:hypothetical protein [Enterococcus ureasiticus]